MSSTITVRVHFSSTQIKTTHIRGTFSLIVLRRLRGDITKTTLVTGHTGKTLVYYGKKYETFLVVFSSYVFVLGEYLETRKYVN